MPPSIHPPFYHIFLSIKVLLSFIVYIRQSHMDFKAEICGHKLQHCYLLVTSSLEFYSNSLSFSSSTKKKIRNDSNTHLTGCFEELKYTAGLAHQGLKWKDFPLVLHQDAFISSQSYSVLSFLLLYFYSQKEQQWYAVRVPAQWGYLCQIIG